MTIHVGDLGLYEVEEDTLLMLTTCQPTKKDVTTAEFTSPSFYGSNRVVVTVLDTTPYKPLWFAISDHKRTGYMGSPFYKVLLTSGYFNSVCYLREEDFRTFTWNSLTDKG